MSPVSIGYSPGISHVVQRQLPHCLTQIVTLRKWLPQLKRYRNLGRQPHGRRLQQDGEAGTCGNDPGPIPAIFQEGQSQDSPLNPHRSCPNTWAHLIMPFPQYLLFTLLLPASVTSPLHRQPWDPRSSGRWSTIPPLQWYVLSPPITPCRRTVRVALERRWWKA